MHKDISRSLVQRLFTVITGIASTFAVPFFLSADQQGYYYTFASVLAIQVFFELGLSQVLLYKFSSFAIAGPDLAAPIDSLKILKLLYASRKIYILISLLFFLAASATGYTFFSHSSNSLVEWRPQWFLLVFVTSINLLQSVKLVFLESQGSIADVATLRLKINFYSTSLLLGILACGGGLWAVSVVPSVNTIASTWWLYRSPKSLAYRKNRNLDIVFTLKDIGQIWRQEIFPLQWRMSLSWLSGYFIFQLITPITFNRFGPVVAGQLGFAISAMNSILFVATTFTTAIAPRLSSLFHSGKIHEFNAMFDISLKRSCAAIILLSQLFVLMVYLLSAFQISISSRFLEWQTLLLYSFSVVVSAVVYCWAIYLRSQAIEPLVMQSMATAVVMVPLIWAFSYVSLGAMLGAMLFVSIGSAIAVWRIYVKNRLQLKVHCA
jgi:hypothetical protein